ncbi:MAG: mevalonate kinase [Anaerolineae bacterium]|nr:mevalonate kinase [Anaerolineae bacterium]
MPVKKVERSAPGKIILCGEHSVVYGHPAIAVPISDMRSYARVVPGPAGQGLRICALDLNQECALMETTDTHPLGRLARLVLRELDLPEPDAVLTVASELPIASGMGSGASISVAAARALSAALGAELPPEAISRITYEVEKIHHGTPSGIDNTVIAWEQPVYFVKDTSPRGPLDDRPEMFEIHAPLKLLIANSGIASSTKEAVDEVRRRWTATPAYYDIVFNCIGAIARAARAAVEQGALHALGTLINENHELLVKMGVSLPQLDQLIAAARAAGALGAKLTGSGQGGNIIALVEDETKDAVQKAVIKAGAVSVWQTTVGLQDA